ncbi:hypothetical protein GCM10010345_13980 [Streptomyces canarius]|uniref:Lipoprotein n=1 Tax=Streptomyces canarius TaxID=285453 RepID=A0ABQ3CLA0_9ACTN|nr:hypothetical protein GCM10010345_13980 [Streptomyces canarius]
MKAGAAIVGAVALGPLLLIAPLAIALAGANSAQAACTGSDAQAVDATAVGKQVESILKGGGKATASVPGLDDPAEQIPNAKTIQATGVAMKVPARGQVVALATALRESGLRNLTYGDRDSLGLFQQRPSQGWGTAQDVRDPGHASTKFYEALLESPGWQSMTVAQAAQAVQKDRVWSRMTRAAASPRPDVRSAHDHPAGPMSVRIHTVAPLAAPVRPDPSSKEILRCVYEDVWRVSR